MPQWGQLANAKLGINMWIAWIQLSESPTQIAKFMRIDLSTQSTQVDLVELSEGCKPSL